MFDFLKQVGKAFVDGMGLNAEPRTEKPKSSAKPTPPKNSTTWSSTADSALSRISVSPVQGGNNAPPAPSKANASTIVPDKPAPFGYKNSWLCVKAGSPEEVIEKLGLKNPRVSNWKDGVYGEKGTFVSPVLDGFVLVVNWGWDILETNPVGLDELGGKFGELQYFCTHRVSEYHTWVKYSGGVMIRGYCYCGDIGEVLMNRGELTPEESELGLDNLLPDNDADWDNYDFPDEQNVLDIAAAWGIDTNFTKKTYPESTGYICDI